MKFNKDLTKGPFQHWPPPSPHHLTFQVFVLLLSTNVAALNVWISWNLFTSMHGDALVRATGGEWGAGSEQMTVVVMSPSELRDRKPAFFLPDLLLRSSVGITHRHLDESRVVEKMAHVLYIKSYLHKPLEEIHLESLRHLLLGNLSMFRMTWKRQEKVSWVQICWN